MSPYHPKKDSRNNIDLRLWATAFKKISGVLLLLSFVLLLPITTWGSDNLEPIYHLLLSNNKILNSKRIFIIGSSTVHAGWFRSGDFNDPYGDNRVLEGWGEQLDKYMKDPVKLYNRARSGSDSVAYRTPNDTRPGFIDRHWANTEALINATADGNGGFLLIQFGANDSHLQYDNGPPRVSVEDFQNELRAYIDDARRLGLTPVLISPPGARSHGENTRLYAPLIKPIAVEKNALFINLYEKAKTKWLDYDQDANGDLPEADKLFSYVQRHSGINNTHYGRIGAKIVAGWVKELACEDDYSDRSQAVQDIAAELCNQFVQGNLVHNITMREDAEDGDTDDWETYGTTAGSSVINLYDTDKRSNVIVLQGNDGLNNGFRYSNDNLWEEENEHVLSWQMQYSEDFTFFVAVHTEDGYKTFEYQPTNTQGQITASGRYNFGLGADANDGSWHTFTRDLQADLTLLDPGKHIIRIHRIAVRGSGRIDNIRTMRSIGTISRDIAPTVAVIGDAEITVDPDSVYNDAGATVVDDNDADIADRLETIGSVNTATEGTYTILYKVHDSVGNGGYAQRVVHVGDIIVHEDAEDGDTEGWAAYAGAGNASNVVSHGGRALSFSGPNGTGDAYAYNIPNVTEGFVVSWAMNFAQEFKFMVRVTTENNGPVYITYVPEDIDQGYLEEGGIQYAYFALGANANDGTWRDFTRDIAADLHSARPDFTITAITGFRVRGTGMIDDISTRTRAGKETFFYNGHSYKIVKTARSWQDASTAAHNDGGYLANIGSIAENHEIYSRLYRYITQGEYGDTDTTSANGGGASYVWIGGNDLDSEGTWRWENNNISFWSGGVAGNGVGGLYSNWGRDANENPHEPDDANNQDAAGIALTRWPISSGSLGQASQWNDLIADTELYSIIEHD